MKLVNAKLCAECDEIVDMEEEKCHSCLCSQFFYLSRLIQPKLPRAEIDLIRTNDALEQTGERRQ
jgi:hypothetical protein